MINHVRSHFPSKGLFLPNHYCKTLEMKQCSAMCYVLCDMSVPNEIKANSPSSYLFSKILMLAELILGNI